MYRTFEHTADVGIETEASSRSELFAEAAKGLFSLIVERLDAVQAREPIQIELPPDEDDYLLFDWLNELLYRFDTERLVFGRFQVRINAAGLNATAWGEPLDPRRHGLGHEVKAITYHQLRVWREADVWRARFIVDI